MLAVWAAGILIAMAASSRVGHATSECAWYFVAYTFDTTLGVTLAIVLHNAAVRGAQQLQESAESFEPTGIRMWAAVIAKCGDYGKQSPLEMSGPNSPKS